MKKLLMSLCMITLAACAGAKESDAVDSQGMCKQALLDAYNGTNAKIKAGFASYKEFGSSEGLQVAQKSCEAYKLFMANQSCKATAEDGSTLNVNEDSLDKQCSATTTLIKIVDESAKINESKPTETEDQKPVKKNPKRRSK